MNDHGQVFFLAGVKPLIPISLVSSRRNTNFAYSSPTVLKLTLEEYSVHGFLINSLTQLSNRTMLCTPLEDLTSRRSRRVRIMSMGTVIEIVVVVIIVVLGIRMFMKRA
jgi:hypothetical protein